MRTLGQIISGSFAVDTAEEVVSRGGKSCGQLHDQLPKPDPSSKIKRSFCARAVREGDWRTKTFSRYRPSDRRRRTGDKSRRIATERSVSTVNSLARTFKELTAASFCYKPGPRTGQSDRVFKIRTHRPIPRSRNTPERRMKW